MIERQCHCVERVERQYISNSASDYSHTNFRKPEIDLCPESRVTDHVE